MEILWLILGGICAILGILGSVLPVLPGPPISYATLWMLWLYDSELVPIWVLVIAGLFMVVITILDYIAPVWLTKLGGGSKSGEIGAPVGVIIGLFIMPEGIILGPFIGALIGELIAQTPFLKALKVAFMSLLAFLLSTGMKLIYGFFVLIYWFVILVLFIVSLFT